MKIISRILLCFLFPLAGFSQNTDHQDSVRVGKSFPPFVLGSVEHYTAGEVSSASLRGKFVILDFWAISCPSCFEGFRKIDSLKKKFGDRVQFFLVGRDRIMGKTTMTAKVAYELYRDLWKYDVPVAYDNEFYKKLDIPFYPYYVWIDDKGIVKALTSSPEVTEKNINDFVNGKDVVVDNPFQSMSVPYDYSKPLLINGNGGADSAFLFRSVLARWNTDSPMSIPFYISSAIGPRGHPFYAAIQPNRVQLNGASLKHMIQMAYSDTLYSKSPNYFSHDERILAHFTNTTYGKYWPVPILEVRDSSDFAIDYKTGKNLYSYSLIVPPAMGHAGFLRKAMQNDISTYFNYAIHVEVRDMPCWNLTATEDARHKLKTAGGKMLDRDGYAEILTKNIPVYELIHHLDNYTHLTAPIMDKTNIQTNIDIDLKAAMLDFGEVRKALAEHGLILEKGSQKMKVIVVRDRKQQATARSFRKR